MRTSGRSLITLVAMLAVLAAAAGSKPKVLVLLDNLSMQQKLLQGLKARGYDLEVASVDAKTVSLKEWDDWLYDKLVILGGSKSASLARTACSAVQRCRPMPSEHPI